MHEPGADKNKKKKIDPVAQALDRMLADAKMGPELIQSLGSGLKTARVKVLAWVSDTLRIITFNC